MSEGEEPFAAPSEEFAAAEPVARQPGEGDDAPTTGLALCLSGGGYRAMLFHVGVLWRLNEAGMLRELDRIASVSGGSITAGVLGLNWSKLDFDEAGVAGDFNDQLVEPVRRMAGVGIDVTAVLAGLGLPFTSVSDRVAKAYRKHLFGKATLQSLPDAPRFVFNATNLESGVLMRFSKAYLADYRVGQVLNPDLPLAVAVAASSAFPPVLSPCTIDLEHEDWVTLPGNDLTTPDFRGQIRLSDGGVYDNLGLQPAWNQFRTLLVADAGGHMGADPSPATDWARHSARVLQVIDNQVRSLRKRQVIEAFRADRRAGAYLGIRSHVEDYHLADAMPADPTVTIRLAATPTRLDDLPAERQEMLINWGYVITDTGVRKHVRPALPRGELPYPSRPLVK
ncbi:patatin-like phospholipase family protein [Nocardioides cavernae]|uniref:Patatin-like phospholipase family protein n=1 Tax=Nocardioides cavernae TaxID=1921566 RepID=A0ABR8NGD7_9ACTN|nr:patatin-like phospholipase family protein [Nocardioides cavernae]MBD3926331.1 patatin-like phospholipase family protein [Nocardioides cavernae]MBM7513924.1 NTE family protein [Nocardioides cavernae]